MKISRIFCLKNCYCFLGGKCQNPEEDQDQRPRIEKTVKTTTVYKNFRHLNTPSVASTEAFYPSREFVEVVGRGPAREQMADPNIISDYSDGEVSPRIATIS